MLELTEEEQRALQVVCLRTEVKQEKYGAANQANWKKLASAGRTTSKGVCV